MFTFNQAELEKLMASTYSDGVRYALDYIINELGIDISDSDIAEEYLENQEAK